MTFRETLSSQLRSVTSYLLERDVPISTLLTADGVRKVLTTPLVILQRLVVISPPRLLICLTLIGLLLLGAWIISMLYGR